jgi:hypothetical protein
MKQKNKEIHHGLLFQEKEELKIFLFTSKWMEVVNIILMKLARLRRPKIACCPSHVDCRPKKIALVLLGRGYKLRRKHTQEE